MGTRSHHFRAASQGLSFLWVNFKQDLEVLLPLALKVQEVAQLRLPRDSCMQDGVCERAGRDGRETDRHTDSQGETETDTKREKTERQTVSDRETEAERLGLH